MRTIGLEIAASSGILDVQTAATGTNYVQGSDVACNQVTLANATGTTICIRKCTSAGTSIASSGEVKVATAGTFTIRGISNANQVKIKRLDDSNTQVTAQLYYEAIA